MKITDFKINKDAGIITWNANGNSVAVSCENLDGAYLYSKIETVLVLSGAGDFPTDLFGYSADGIKIFEKEAPEGFVFSYITEHPTAGIAVVCGGKEKIDGWYDWHFSVDPSTGKLSRHCPAY